MEALCCHSKALHQATGTPKKQGDSQKAKALWAVKAARDRGDEFYDPARQHDIHGRTRSRKVLWEEHLESPVKTFMNVEVWVPRSFVRVTHRSFVCVTVFLDGGQRGLCKDVAGTGCGLVWICEMLWVCARQAASGVSRRTMGSTASTSFPLLRRTPSFSRRRFNSGPVLLQRH